MYSREQNKSTSIKSMSVCLVFLSISIVLIPALLSPVLGAVVVRMENDEIIADSISILESNFNKLKIIDYNTLEYAIKISRTTGPVIWVGHGSMEGIQTADKSISWIDFSSCIRNTPSSDIVLSCYSSNLVLSTKITQEEAMTFNGEIDNIYGALIVSYLCDPSLEVANDLISHRKALLDGKTDFTPLGGIFLDPGPGGGSDSYDIDIPWSYDEVLANSDSYIFLKCSGAELVYWVIMSVVLLIEIVFLIHVSAYNWDFIMTTIVKIFTTGLIVNFTVIVMMAINAMTAEEAAGEMVGAMVEVGGLLYDAFVTTSAAEKIAWGVLLFLSIIAQIAIAVADALGAAGLLTTLRIAASILLIAAWITNFVFDIVDVDMLIG